MTPPRERNPIGPYRAIVVGCFGALIVLGLLWEMWLAPLRPGGSMLVLKVLPLAIALPPLIRGRIRAYQWWSMGVLLYLCEGLVRSTSESGLSAGLAAFETVLAAVAFAAILMLVRASHAKSRGGEDKG